MLIPNSQSSPPTHMATTSLFSTDLESVLNILD